MPNDGKTAFWKVFGQFSPTNYLMCSHQDGQIRYAPLLIHSFRLIAPKKILDAQLFNCQYPSYQSVQTPHERLRWCRYQQGLLQKDIARMVGISVYKYIDYELGKAEYIPKEIADKLAAIYHVPPTDLLDEYNCFLYHGQGRLIRQYRKSLHLSIRAFAEQTGIPRTSVQNWEKEKKRINRLSWEKYFKGKIEAG